MYKILLPIRYLLKRRISLLAILAVFLCTFITVVVMAVLSGLVSNFKQKNHEFAGDCVVTTDSLVGFPFYEEFTNKLEQRDYIKTVSPVIHNFGLLTPEWSDKGFGVEILGIEQQTYTKVTDFAESLHFRKGAVDIFSPPYSPNSPGCVLGIDMRFRRNAEGGYDLPDTLPGEAYTISCIPLTAKGALAKAGTTTISSKTFYLTDVSQRGLVTPDGKFVYIPFEDAQLLGGMAGAVKRASSLHIKFTDPSKLEEITRKVASLWDDFVRTKSQSPYNNLLGQVSVKSWKSYRRESISAMEKEQVMMTALFVLVGLTAVFIVFVVFYMLVNHKRKDLGILKSLGAGNADIAAMLSFFASLIAIIGSVAGTAGAWLFLSRINIAEQWLFETFGFQLWNRSIYAIGKIPSDLPLSLALTVAVCAVLACMLGGSIPIYKAAKSEPIQTLQVGE